MNLRHNIQHLLTTNTNLIVTVLLYVIQGALVF